MINKSHKFFLFLAFSFFLLTPNFTFATELAEDKSSASVYTYFRISDDGNEASLSPHLFKAQIDEIKSGSYHVLSLSDILSAHASNQNLPPQTIALTLEGTDPSLFSVAIPALLSARYPFTIFISPGQLDADTRDKNAITWREIRALRNNPLIEIALTSYQYTHQNSWTQAELARDLNRARARVREELNLEPQFFAYPYGEYSEEFLDLIATQGFKAGFGQHSGLLYRGQDVRRLPRFTMIDEFGDIDRFRMTSMALPLPVADPVPLSTYLTQNPPVIGFTLSPKFSKKEIANLQCFASDIGPLKILKLPHNRVEIRSHQPFDGDKTRVNCTLAVIKDGRSETLYRWLGFLFTTEKTEGEGIDETNPPQP